MKYYKQIKDNILVGVYKSNNLPLEEITEEEYNSIISIIQTKPEDTDTTIYKLNAETLEYEPYDRPEEPTPTEPTDPTIDSIIEEVAQNGYN